MCAIWMTRVGGHLLLDPSENGEFVHIEPAFVRELVVRSYGGEMPYDEATGLPHAVSQQELFAMMLQQLVGSLHAAGERAPEAMRLHHRCADLLTDVLSSQPSRSDDNDDRDDLLARRRLPGNELARQSSAWAYRHGLAHRTSRPDFFSPPVQVSDPPETE